MIFLKYSAILFDFDGTLTESGIGITRSAAYAFEKLGLPVPSREELDTFIGPPLVVSFMKYGNMSKEKAIEATELYRVRYRQTGWKENRLYPGIAPLLKQLKHRIKEKAIQQGFARVVENTGLMGRRAMTSPAASLRALR